MGPKHNHLETLAPQFQFFLGYSWAFSLPGEFLDQLIMSGKKKKKKKDRTFLGSENPLYDTVTTDTDHYIFVQTQRMYHTKSEPWCKLSDLGDYDVSVWVHQL